jgi:DNA replication licensing factor MCM3
LQYDIHKDPHKNIALPDSLLSRFDLLFIVTDDVDATRDRQIADHVLRLHRYLPPGVEEGTPLPDTLSQPLYINGPNVPDEEDAVETSPFEKYDPLLHAGFNAPNTTGRRVTRSSRRAKKHEILSIAFVKKYIQYAKSKMAPTLTQGAAEHIVQVYSNLRNEDMERNQRKVIKKENPHKCEAEATLLSIRLLH